VLGQACPPWIPQACNRNSSRRAVCIEGSAPAVTGSDLSRVAQCHPRDRSCHTMPTEKAAARRGHWPIARAYCVADPVVSGGAKCGTIAFRVRPQHDLAALDGGSRAIAAGYGPRCAGA